MVGIQAENVQRFAPHHLLEDGKAHHRHRSISREARDKGSIHDTDSDRVVEWRVRVLRCCVCQATALGTKSMTRDYAHVVKGVLETDSVSGRVSRHDWVRLGVDAWTHSGCGCRQLSTGERQRFGQSQEPATKHTL